MHEPIYTLSQGLLLLAGYAVFAFGITAFFAGRRPASKAAFLVADRKVSGWASALSIAATWVWAPALFIASREAYRRGWVGLFWFTVPNVLCLVLFAFFAERMRAALPEGFTLSGYMRQRFSPRVQALYWIELSALAACSFAVQLLAGGLVVAQLSGLPFFVVTLALAAIALAYSAFSGLRASVATDVAQMILILGVGAVLVPWMVETGGGWGTVREGLAGRSGAYTSIWSGEGLETAWVFGIPVTIGLLAGPFGDQSFWQRAFAVRRNRVRHAFIGGALIFALVPLLLSLPGFLAAGRAWDAANPELVGLEMVIDLLPAWTVVPFSYLLLSGLASTLDSNLCAIASIGAHDLAGRRAAAPDHPLRTARLSMAALAAAALVIANLPGMKILYLFLFYGTLRASTWLPTVIALRRERVSESAMFFGILSAILVGLPTFAAGNFFHRPALALAGSLLTIGLSGGWVWAKGNGESFSTPPPPGL